MNDRTLGILFAVATAIFWGLYGPALGKARGPEWSPFKPYVFIGVAYMVWGIVGGAVAMKVLGDNFSFSGSQSPSAIWGFLAGSLGAFGALTLTYAMFKAKNAGLVMPIVFGGAVSVTAITSLVMLRAGSSQPGHGADPRLWVGMLLVAAGIVLVAMYTPHAAPAKKVTTSATTSPTGDGAGNQPVESSSSTPH
ncbi:MAG: hypothetical protein R3C01_08050 [Planctomycetaceae bacterium]